MKVNLSKAVIVIICVCALALAAISTYLVFDLSRELQNVAKDPEYDYMIFQQGSLFFARNQATGLVDISSSNASLVITEVLSNANRIYLGPGNYSLSSDIRVYNKTNARIIGDGACITGNGRTLVFAGYNYTYSQNNLLSGLTIINGTVRIENSFRTTVSNIHFENCATALEFANTNTWSEGTKIEDCRFINSNSAIIFKTPVNVTASNTTGSYASTEITRCFFNLPNDSVGINVERLAELSDSQLRNVRMWMGENGSMRNQTGLLVDGTMHQTLLFGVVFESFADSPDEMYAMELGADSVTPPILAGGVSFLGKWTSKIHTVDGKLPAGSGSVFKIENKEIPVGLVGEYGEISEIHIDPLTISSFKAKMQVQGSFSNNETVTVKFRLAFIDNTVSQSVEKQLTGNTSVWLSDDDILLMYPSRNIIWRILVEAKASSASSDATVRVSVYGTVA